MRSGTPLYFAIFPNGECAVDSLYYSNIRGPKAKQSLLLSANIAVMLLELLVYDFQKHKEGKVL